MRFLEHLEDRRRIETEPDYKVGDSVCDCNGVEMGRVIRRFFDETTGLWHYAIADSMSESRRSTLPCPHFQEHDAIFPEDPKNNVPLSRSAVK